MGIKAGNEAAIYMGVMVSSLPLSDVEHSRSLPDLPDHPPTIVTDNVPLPHPPQGRGNHFLTLVANMGAYMRKRRNKTHSDLAAVMSSVSPVAKSLQCISRSLNHTLHTGRKGLVLLLDCK